MPNTLTDLIPKALTACQEVFAEKASLVGLVDTRYSAVPAALNEVITIPIVPVVAGSDRVSAMVPTIAADRVATSTNITITKDRKFPFHMTGEDYLRIRQNPDFVPASLKQAIRACRNEIHSDLADLNIAAAGYYSAASSSSGAAVGVAGTAPFASDTKLVTALERMLNDSLAPMEGRTLFLGTPEKQALGDLGQLFKANESGSADLLRRGIVGQLSGFDVVWDQVVKSGAAIAGAGYVTNGVQAVGATSIVVQTGTGAIPRGTVISFAADTVNRYVVAADYAGGAGTLTITSGLVNQIAGSNAITLSAGRRNMAFHRDALSAIVRPSALPPDGDMAADTAVITDPVSGVSMRLSNYKGYGLNQWEVQACWGVKAVRPELLKLLLG